MARNFNDVLSEIDGGRAHEELSRVLAQVTAAAIELNKPGEVTFTLKVKPNKDNAVFLETGIKAKIPEAGIATAMFFADEEGSLTRRDPRQADMFTLKAIASAPEAPAKLLEVPVQAALEKVTG